MTRHKIPEIGREAHPLYKKRYQPKHRKDGTFKRSKKNKYNSRSAVIDGRTFHSQAEADRYLQLKMLQAAGKIHRLEMQIPYRVVIDNTPICTYYADFRYFLADNTAIVIEDVKGKRTNEYLLKKKMVEAQHKIRITELPGSWLKHYEGRHGLELAPIIAELEKERKERAKARKLAALRKTKAPEESC
jgi:hypothetical protein